MLRTNCWNCGARLNGSQCQMCGAAQQSAADQPVERQAPGAFRPASQGAGAYIPGRQPQYVPGDLPEIDWYGQSAPYEGQYAPDAPGQQPGISSYGMSELSLSSGAPPYVPGAQPVAPPPVAQSRTWEALSVPLATLGGLTGGIIAAAFWALFLHTLGISFPYASFLLGVAVGFGVALGARGHHDIGLSLFAGVLGLLSFCLTLYFRLSLAESHLLGEGINFFALSLNDFSNTLGDYLVHNPFNFLNFGLVPMTAMGMAYRRINRGRDGAS